MQEDFELTLFDRLEVIRKTIKEISEDNCYISFSGGKDSTMLSFLIDEALPGNNIPRVYINTGIEYNAIVAFVHKMMETDKRIVEIKPTLPIRKTLETYGYPFKSKEHSCLIAHRNSNAPSIVAYFEGGGKRQTHCPSILMYQYKEQLPFPISDKCCYKLKKEPVHKWEKENGRHVAILGLKTGEGGQRRTSKGCIVLQEGKIRKFKPLNPVSDEFEEWYIRTRNIRLCELYYEPYNFTRTGCKGCPYAIDISDELDKLEKLLPNERKQCEVIWGKVYDEYRRLKYRKMGKN